MDIDIYDLSNFNIGKEPEHIIEIKKVNDMIIVRRNNIEQIYDRFVPLMDVDVEIKTIKIVSTYEYDTYRDYIILRRDKLMMTNDYYDLYLNKFININPASYYVDTCFEYNYIIYIYEYNPKYDIYFYVNYLRRMSLMSLVNKIDVIDVIYPNGPNSFAFVYIIDVYYYCDDNTNIKINNVNIKGKYLSDIISRNDNAIIYMKVFKINHNSIRIYIERIKLLNEIIYLCKFNGNQFNKFHNIEFINQTQMYREKIQINNFPCGLPLDIHNSEIATHMVNLKCKMI